MRGHANPAMTGQRVDPDDVSSTQPSLSSIRIRDQDTMSHFTVYKKTQNSL